MTLICDVISCWCLNPGISHLTGTLRILPHSVNKLLLMLNALLHGSHSNHHTDYSAFTCIFLQECIPLGCVPPASVAIGGSAGRGCLPSEGVCPESVCPGGCLPGGVHHPVKQNDWQTGVKSLPCRKRRLRPVKEKSYVKIYSYFTITV